MSDTTWHTVTVRIPFASNKHATIAKRVIDVDVELQRHAVKRTLTVEGDELIATFQALTIRSTRLSINGFLENVDLVVRTIGEFGEEASATEPEMTESDSESEIGQRGYQF